TGTVTVNVGGQMVTVQLPAGISIPATFVGRAFELALRIAAPGVPVDNDDNDDHGNDANHGGHGGGDDGGGHGGRGRGYPRADAPRRGRLSARGRPRRR